MLVADNNIILAGSYSDYILVNGNQIILKNSVYNRFNGTTSYILGVRISLHILSRMRISYM